MAPFHTAACQVSYLAAALEEDVVATTELSCRGSDPGPMGPFVGSMPFASARQMVVEHMAGGTSRIVTPLGDANADLDGCFHEGAVLALLDTAGAMAAWGVPEEVAGWPSAARRYGRAMPIDHAVLDGLLRRAGREVDEGLLPACQIAVAHRGRLLATRTCGASPTSRFLIYSCTKAITAGAVWRVMGDGLLQRSTRVADLVPAFAENGLDTVTVEHLLTHTAGVPSARMPDDDWADPQRRVERFASWRLEWEPGSRFVYHGSSAHWVLAQLVETVTGTDFRTFVRDAVLGPLSLDSLCLGPAAGDQDDVLDVVGVGDVVSEAELDALGGSIGLDVSAIGTSERDLLRHNDPAVRAVGQPGGGAVGRAADLALYYQALLTNPGGLWRPDVLAAGTAEVACDLIDPMTGAPAHRTLGLVMAGTGESAMLRGFASTSSPRAFGHMGAGGQVAWADPASGLSFAYLTNGLDRNPVRMGARGLSLSYRAGAVAAPER